MSWYVMQCKTGQEEMMIRSCIRHLSACALDAAFTFRCERLWRTGGIWELEMKEMFPGYVFLESSRPGLLSKELKQYRKIFRVLEEPGYLISVYEEEEIRLRQLCGLNHSLKLSYGYKADGMNHITQGPLKGMEDQISRFDWHRRFAKIEVTISGKKSVVWAGLGLDEKAIKTKCLVS